MGRHLENETFSSIQILLQFRMAIERKFISMGYKSVLKMQFRLLPFRFDESQRVTEFTYLSSRFLSSVLTIAAMQYEFLIKSDS